MPITPPPIPNPASERSLSSPSIIDGEFEHAPPPSRGPSWSLVGFATALVALVGIAGVSLWIYLHQADTALPLGQQSVNQALPAIDVSAITASRMAVVDVGAITVAWGASGGSDANAVALKLKQQLDRLAQSGVVVIESRYALVSPATSDITTQLASSIGVDMKALLATPASPYATPVAPITGEGTGWRTGPIASPASDTRIAAPPASKKADPKVITPPEDD